MDYVGIPGTELKVSRLCFGTMTFGGQTNEADAARMLDRTIEAGINFFDTANVYNKGESEAIVGRLLGERRKDIVLATKVRGKMGDAPDESGLSRAAIVKAIEDSLRRLKTDYVDVYYLHQPDSSVPIDVTLDAMEQVIRQGKARYPAVSNYSSWQVLEMHWIAQQKEYHTPFLAQQMYNLIARDVEDEFLPMAGKYRLSVIAYNPLAGGLLTGKQRKAAPIEGSRFDGNKMYLDRYWHDVNFQAVKDLEEIAEKAGRSMVSLALNWLLHHTQTASVILGASRMEQLEENLQAAGEGPLSKEVVAGVDEVYRRLRGEVPKYNR